MRPFIKNILFFSLAFSLSSVVSANAGGLSLRNFNDGHYQLVEQPQTEGATLCTSGHFALDQVRGEKRLSLYPAAGRSQHFYMQDLNDSFPGEEGCSYDIQNRVTYQGGQTTLTFDEHHKCNNGASILYHERIIIEIQADRIELSFERSRDDNPTTYRCAWERANQ